MKFKTLGTLQRQASRLYKSNHNSEIEENHDYDDYGDSQNRQRMGQTIYGLGNYGQQANNTRSHTMGPSMMSMISQNTANSAGSGPIAVQNVNEGFGASRASLLPGTVAPTVGWGAPSMDKSRKTLRQSFRKVMFINRLFFQEPPKVSYAIICKVVFLTK